jgi:hypothetical protein
MYISLSVTRGANSYFAGQNPLAGHTQQPSEPDCLMPTAPPPPADTPSALNSRSGTRGEAFCASKIWATLVVDGRQGGTWGLCRL